MAYVADGFKLTLSTQLQFLFKGLPERSFMTPTYLSRLIMYIVLPSTTSVPKEALEPNRNTCLVNRCLIQGMDTIEYLVPHCSLYTVYFSGNAQDSMQLSPIDKEQNYVFWNYPGVGNSLGAVNSSYDLFEAGYQQVKRLIDKKIDASLITLYGQSLGGGIATHVARRLQAEGHHVHLTVDRSFARLSSVIPALLAHYLRDRQKYMLHINEKDVAQLDLSSLPRDYPTCIRGVNDTTGEITNYIYYNNNEKWERTLIDSFYTNLTISSPMNSYPKEKLTVNKVAAHELLHDLHPFKASASAPLVTSVIALTLSGIALGTSFAGLMATLGLGMSLGLAGLGYAIAYTIQLPGFILANLIDAFGTMIAYLARGLANDTTTRIPPIFAGLSYAVEYPFAWLGFMLNEAIQLFARTLYYFVNVLASIAGGALGIAGGLAGILMGFVTGAIGSLQLLATNDPYLTPTEFAFSAVLISACCEMDSVVQMRRLVANASQNQNCTIINSQNDEVIRVDAALSTGLGIKPASTKAPEDENTPLTSANRSVFWYTKGGHTGFLNPEFALPKQTFH